MVAGRVLTRATQRRCSGRGLGLSEPRRTTHTHAGRPGKALSSSYSSLLLLSSSRPFLSSLHHPLLTSPPTRPLSSLHPPLLPSLSLSLSPSRPGDHRHRYTNYFPLAPEYRGPPRTRSPSQCLYISPPKVS